MECECECGRAEELCARCRHARFEQLRVEATARGQRWSAQLARSMTGRWPIRRSSMLAIATTHVADLANDRKLREQLAMEMASSAERAWPADASPIEN